MAALTRRPLLWAAAAAVGGIVAADAFAPTLRLSLLFCLAAAALLAAALALPFARRARWVPLTCGALLAAALAASWFTWRTAPYQSPGLEAVMAEDEAAARAGGGSVRGTRVGAHDSISGLKPAATQDDNRSGGADDLGANRVGAGFSPHNPLAGSTPAAPPPPAAYRQHLIRGMISGAPSTAIYPLRTGSYSRVRFTLAVSELDGHPCRGTLLVHLQGGQSSLAYGDEIMIAVRLEKADAPANPGESDFARHLYRNGISAFVPLNRPEDCLPTGRVPGSRLVRAGLAYKQRCLDAIDAALPDERGALLKCLLMGRTSDLEAAVREPYRETGTLHLLAISGTHIVMVAGSVWLVLVLLGAGPRATAAAVILVVSGYALLAGLAPGVQRAAVGCIVLCGAYLFRRKPDAPTGMALALLLVLALNPADLFNVGMQLSFAAVAGLYLFTIPIERALFGPPDDLERIQDPAERSAWLRWLWWTARRSLSLSLAASLATVPLMAYHFNTFTPLAPVATLLLTPAVTLAMAAGLPAALLGPLIAPVVMPLFKIAGAGVWAMDALACALARLPGVAQYGPSPGLWLTLAACAVPACMARWPQWLWRPWRAVGLLLLPAALYFAFVWRQPPPAHAELTMLSLGEANCEVVRFPDGRTLLFDAGGRNKNIGGQIIAPALWAAGVRRIDLALLSHADSDHTVAFEELARRIPVGCIALPAHFDNDKDVKDWVTWLSESFRVVRIARGDRIEGFPQAQIRVLWPPEGDLFARVKETNPLSAVLDIGTDGGRILLTGDLNGVGALALCGEEPDLRARIVQVPHHGRVDASSAALAAAVSPGLALVPGGARAAPFPWLAHSQRLLTTEECGMITVELAPGALQVRTFRSAGEGDGPAGRAP